MAQQATEDASPAWGLLPVEQYLLTRWDSSSALPVEEQRAQLVQAFIQEDDVTAFFPPAAPADALPAADKEELIRTVLAPWRPQQMRRIAEKHVFGNSPYHILLRTYYGGGAYHDEQLAEWLEQADPIMDYFGPENERWWTVLDDAALFDLGSEHWTSVFDRLPELAAPAARREFAKENFDSVQEIMQLKGDDPIEDDFEECIMSVAGKHWLLLDKQAFQEEEFGLMFQDRKGNIIKQGAIEPAAFPGMQMDLSRGYLECYWFAQAWVGDKYRTRGEIMRTLLPVAKAIYQKWDAAASL